MFLALTPKRAHYADCRYVKNYYKTFLITFEDDSIEERSTVLVL